MESPGYSAPFTDEESDDYARDSTVSISLSTSAYRTGDLSSWLLKRGNRYKSWKRRYFVIIDNLISYYTDETQTKKKGEIFLEDISSCQLLPNPDKEEGFILKTAGRDWYVIAEDFPTKYLWTDHLSAMGISGEPYSPKEMQQRSLDEKDRLLREKERLLFEKEKELQKSKEREKNWREAYESLKEQVGGSNAMDEDLLDLYGISLNGPMSKDASFENTEELNEQLLEQIQQMQTSIQLEKKSSKKLLKDLGLQVQSSEDEEEEEFPEEQTVFFMKRSMKVFSEESVTSPRPKRTIEACQPLMSPKQSKRVPETLVIS